MKFEWEPIVIIVCVICMVLMAAYCRPTRPTENTVLNKTFLWLDNKKLINLQYVVAIEHKIDEKKGYIYLNNGINITSTQTQEQFQEFWNKVLP